MSYDPDNVFAKILRGELPCKKVHETEHALAFHDINPLTPVHVLVIPKGAYTDFADFTANASPEEIYDFWRAVYDVARMTGVEDSGFRIVSNKGSDAGQIVFHFHVHVFGGRPVSGSMVRPAKN